jgi:IS30 family transposase
MPNRRSYRHLSPEDRAGIMIDLQHGSSLRAMARRLGRSPSTVSREIKRAGSAGYDATRAAAGYRQRRAHSRRSRRLIEGTALYQHVYDHLVFKRWSPQQIAARLRAMPAEERPGLVSHETIYAAIYAQPRGALKQGMVAALRQAKASRGRRRTTAAAGRFVPEASQIQHRPAHIDSRRLPGHWEGDFSKGAYTRSAVGVLVERKTRWVVLCRMNGCTAADALEGFSRQMKRLPAFLRESLTYDRGSELACFEALSRRLKLAIWFCDPHAPWQRGSNENTNGLLRQFLPKGTDLSLASQTQLNDIARLLNGRPRKTLGWKTPDEVMAEEMLKFSTGVALAS